MNENPYKPPTIPSDAREPSKPREPLTIGPMPGLNGKFRIDWKGLTIPLLLVGFYCLVCIVGSAWEELSRFFATIFQP